MFGLLCGTHRWPRQYVLEFFSYLIDEHMNSHHPPCHCSGLVIRRSTAQYRVVLGIRVPYFSAWSRTHLHWAHGPRVHRSAPSVPIIDIFVKETCFLTPLLPTPTNIISIENGNRAWCFVCSRLETHPTLLFGPRLSESDCSFYGRLHEGMENDNSAGSGQEHGTLLQ